jgi:hypothetical protein
VSVKQAEWSAARVSLAKEATFLVFTPAANTPANARVFDTAAHVSP